MNSASRAKRRIAGQASTWPSITSTGATFSCSPSINNFGLNINGGDAKVDGVEFTGTWRPVRGLNTSINFAYTNARLADDLPPVLGVVSAFDGDRLPFTPKFSLGANVDYNWSLGGTTEAFVGASLRTLTNQVADYDADFFEAQR